MAQITELALTGAFPATATLRGRDGFGGSSSRALVREARCGGSAPTARRSTIAEPSVGDVKLAAFALAASRGGREPGGMRHAECTEIVAVAAGDG